MEIVLVQFFLNNHQNIRISKKSKVPMPCHCNSATKLCARRIPSSWFFGCYVGGTLSGNTSVHTSYLASVEGPDGINVVFNLKKNQYQLKEEKTKISSPAAWHNWQTVVAYRVIARHQELVGLFSSPAATTSVQG